MDVGINLDVGKVMDDLWGPGKPSSEQVYGEQMRAQGKELRQRIDIAREMGIHPSVLLGAGASSFSMPVSYDGGGGGSSVSFRTEHGANEVQLTPNQQLMEDSNVRISQANADLAESQAALSFLDLQSRLNPISKPVDRVGAAAVADVAAASGLPLGSVGFGQEHGGSVVLIQPDKVTAPSPYNYGKTAGTHPLYTETVGLDGKRVVVPNPDLNLDPEQLGDVVTLAGNLKIDIGTAMALYAAGMMWPVAAGAGGIAYGGYKAYKAIKAARSLKALKQNLARQERLAKMKKGGK